MSKLLIWTVEFFSNYQKKAPCNLCYNSSMNSTSWELHVETLGSISLTKRVMGGVVLFPLVGIRMQASACSISGLPFASAARDNYQEGVRSRL